MSETNLISQIQERDDGMYPVGINGSWHGGIHFTPADDRWIESMFHGKVVGGKIQKDYYNISYLKEITLTEYDSLPKDEQEYYTEKENGIYVLKDAAKPLEHKYSTSYLLLEHSLIIPSVDKSNTKEERVSINFFMLYMHLLPFGEFTTRQKITEDARLPFYLKWTDIEIKEVKSKIKYYISYTGGNEIEIYDSTKILINDFEYFCPNPKERDLKIYVRNQKMSSYVEIGEDHLFSIEIPEIFIPEGTIRFKLEPNGQEIELYSIDIENKGRDNTFDNKYYLLGNIRANVNDFKLDYSFNVEDKIKNKMIKIKVKDIDEKIINNKPTGFIKKNIIDESKGTINANTWLFSQNVKQAKDRYKCVTFEDYVKINPSAYQYISKTVVVNGVNCAILHCGTHENFNEKNDLFFEIVINNESIGERIIDVSMPYRRFLEISELPGCIVKVYIFQKSAYLQTGQRIKKIERTIREQLNVSIPNEYVKVEALLPLEGDVYADVSKFKGEAEYTFRIKDDLLEASNEGMIPLDIRDKYSIPCRDKDGYITNTLGVRDRFEIKSGSLSDGATLEIYKIRGYSNREAVRFIQYDKKKCILEGKIAVNEAFCTKDNADKNTDVYKFKNNPSVNINTNQIIGKAGKFQSRDEYCHFEMFFKENKDAEKLLKGEYVYKRYSIKDKAVMYTEEAPVGIQLFLPSQSYWKIETGDKYSKLTLLRLQVYFYSDTNDNKNYEIKKDTITANINTKKIIFGKVEGNKRVLLSEEEAKSNNEGELYRYALLIIQLIEKNNKRELGNKDGNLQGLIFKLDDGVDVAQLTFWIKNSDVNQFEQVKNEGNLKKNAGILTIFNGTEDPNYPIFKEMNSDKPEKILYVYGKLAEKSGRDGKTYCEFKDKDKTYYVLKDEVTTENMLDFSDKELNLFSKVEASSDKEIYCGEDKINEMAGEKVVYKDYPLLFLPSDVREKMRYLVSLFPTEWNKELYKLCGEDCVECTKPYRNECEYYPREMFKARHDWRYAPMKAEIMGKADVWNEADVFKNREKMLWHIHPVKLYNHLDKVGLLDMRFNPYYKKDFICGPNVVDKEKRPQLNIQDSPGFAPLCKEGTEGSIEYEGKIYGPCTSLFNVDRYPGYGGPHTGVDLGTGGSYKDIISFVYGEVWACTYHNNTKENSGNGFGKVMIIKDARENKLYFLAHLHDYIKNVGDQVKPGEAVAIAGTTGNSTGIHLHVEVRLCDEKETKKEMVLSSTGNKRNENEGTGLTWGGNYTNEKNPLRVNPFNHKEKFGDNWR